MKLGVRAVRVGEKMDTNVKDGEYIEYWGSIYQEDIKKIDGLEITHNLDKADLVITWNIIPSELMKNRDTPKNPEKLILFIQESPVANHRRMMHKNIDKFHTAITHNPDGPNQISFTDNPSYYPWGPLLDIDLKREDTTIRNRNFFYAARRVHTYENLPDKWDTHVLYGSRVKLVEGFRNKYPDRMKLYGRHWDGYSKVGKSTLTLYSKGTGNWRQHKVEDVEESQADFHIVLENCIQRNLITDHFHDGFSSDRVVFYLGCPNIEDHVPMDIFIDLRPYYNKETKEFDIDKIVEIADNMTQEEYDGYIHRAREWRKSLKNENGELHFHKQAHKLTDKIVKILKDYIKTK